MEARPRDLTLGADYDVPPFNLGDPDAIAFSPDSGELCFTANTDADAAISTNGDLFTVPVAGGAAPKRITTNPANDWGPVYSPDGKWIAYRAQTHPGWESDRWRLILYDRAKGEAINLTENIDRSIESFAWSIDSNAIYFATEEKSEMPVFSIAPAAGSAPKPVLGNGFNNEIGVSKDGRRIGIHAYKPDNACGNFHRWCRWKKREADHPSERSDCSRNLIFRRWSHSGLPAPARRRWKA